MKRELGPTARSLLEAARQGMAPDAAQMARVRAKIGSSIAAGAGGGAFAAIVKLAAVVAIVATTAVAHVAAQRPAVAAPRATPPVIESVRDDFGAAAGVEVRLAAPEAPPPALPIDEAAAPAAAPPMLGDGLAREVALVDRAMTALRQTDPTGALATIAVYDRETAGRGQLAEDAAAIAIEAHCLRGDAVTVELDRFDRLWPASAQRPRLAAACAR